MASFHHQPSEEDSARIVVTDVVKIMIVEDLQIIRLGLRLLLDDIPNFQVIAEADEGNSAVAKAVQLRPDVVLMDIGLPGMDGITATAEIKKQVPDTRVIMLTSHESDDDIFAALGAGANGYCLKDIPAMQLALAINSVKDGGSWLEPRIAQRVVQSYTTGGSAGKNSASKEPDLGLTKTDLTVLSLVEEGLNDAQIAERMETSVESVKKQMRTIVETLFLSDRARESVKVLRQQLASQQSEKEKTLPRIKAAVAAELQKGDLFADRYEILEPAGEGGMGRVYKAKHMHMQRIVAIKILHPGLSEDPRLLRQFQEEAKAVSALNHPNVVTVFDFGVADGQQFLVMDFLTGDSLDDLLEKDKCLDLDHFFSVFDQVLSVLSIAHEKDIVHCDLKPSNIILTRDEKGNEVVKLVDFGLAKILPPPNAGVQMQLTDSFEVSGSPLYMSPEQCTGRQLDCRSDLYSLACVMYEAVSSVQPFAGNNPMEVFSRHLRDTPKSFVEICPERNLLPPLEWLIFKALEKQPERRFQSASDMRAALQAVAKMAASAG